MPKGRKGRSGCTAWLLPIYIYIVLYSLKMVLIGRFFLSPGFLDAQDCKHQGDIGVANRPKKRSR